jgi:hypothetical protein
MSCSPTNTDSATSADRFASVDRDAGEGCLWRALGLEPTQVFHGPLQSSSTTDVLVAISLQLSAQRDTIEQQRQHNLALGAKLRGLTTELCASRATTAELAQRVAALETTDKGRGDGLTRDSAAHMQRELEVLRNTVGQLEQSCAAVVAETKGLSSSLEGQTEHVKQQVAQVSETLGELVTVPEHMRSLHRSIEELSSKQRAGAASADHALHLAAANRGAVLAVASAAVAAVPPPLPPAAAKVQEGQEAKGPKILDPCMVTTAMVDAEVSTLMPRASAVAIELLQGLRLPQVSSCRGDDSDGNTPPADDTDNNDGGLRPSLGSTSATRGTAGADTGSRAASAGAVAIDTTRLNEFVKEQLVSWVRLHQMCETQRCKLASVQAASSAETARAEAAERSLRSTMQQGWHMAEEKTHEVRAELEGRMVGIEQLTALQQQMVVTAANAGGASDAAKTAISDSREAMRLVYELSQNAEEGSNQACLDQIAKLERRVIDAEEEAAEKVQTQLDAVLEDRLRGVVAALRSKTSIEETRRTASMLSGLSERVDLLSSMRDTIDKVVQASSADQLGVEKRLQTIEGVVVDKVRVLAVPDLKPRV